MKEILSGDELYRYLHISKRKLKYFLENGYIPMTDTGKKTHRYLVRREDAITFKRKLTHHPEAFSGLVGKFNNHPPKAYRPPFEPTEANLRAFAKYLEELWRDVPEAILTKNAAALVGCEQQWIRKLCRKGTLESVIVGNLLYCSKESIITYLSSAYIVSGYQSEKYNTYLSGFYTRLK